MKWRSSTPLHYVGKQVAQEERRAQVLTLNKKGKGKREGGMIVNIVRVYKLYAPAASGMQIFRPPVRHGIAHMGDKFLR